MDKFSREEALVKRQLCIDKLDEMTMQRRELKDQIEILNGLCEKEPIGLDKEKLSKEEADKLWQKVKQKTSKTLKE